MSEFVAEFPELYEEDENTGVDMSELEDMGFFPTMKRLCNGDILKRDQVLQVGAREVYTWLKCDKIEEKIRREAANKKK